jgi:hypothetical protein
VRKGIKRARCFRCHADFGVEDVVAKLLGIDAEEYAPPTFPSAVLTNDGGAVIEAGGLGAEEAEEFDAPVPISEGAAPEEDDAIEPMAVPSLEAGGMGAEEAEEFDAPVPLSEGAASAEDDVIEPMPVPGLEASGLGAAADEATSPMATEGFPATEMFEIANDDIAQLIKAEAADAGIETEMQSLDAPKAMDVDEPIQEGLPSADDENTATALAGGTVRLTPEDILAALASSGNAANAPEASAPAAPKEKLPEDASVAQKADIPAATETTAPGPTSEEKPKDAAAPIGAAEPVNNEASKIKVRMGSVLIEQLTIEEVAAMAEEGKLEEHHLVARQFSENWIEAPKVPVLRPIFERLRRNRQPEMPPPPATKAPAPKGGLFGRLFGRN